MTTNDLAVRNDSPTAPAQQPAAIGQLMQHAKAMQTAYDLAKAMCGSELVPAMYKNKPENGAAAILYGMELGLNPIQSLQQIFVVRGTPAIYARTMVALLKSKGHKVWTVESTDESVTVSGQLKGDEHVETSTWTIERAKKAKYTTNDKYQTDPQAMLFAKAASEVCRKIAPDILLGIGYSREELELELPVRVQSERVSAADVLGVAKGDRFYREPEPLVDDTSSREPDEQPSDNAAKEFPADVTPEEPASPEDAKPEEPKPEKLITAAQLKKLWPLLESAGLTNADEALAWMGNVIERPDDNPLDSSKKLTATEAEVVFAELAKSLDGGDQA